MSEPITPRYLSRLRLEKMPEARIWTLTAELRFISAKLRALLVIPSGYCTDLSSVPRAPLTFLLAGDTAHEDGVIHDYLYGTHMCRDRAEADAVFLEAMTVSGVPWWRRRLMYAAVRMAGSSSWDSGPSRFRRLGNESGAAALLPIGDFA